MRVLLSSVCLSLLPALAWADDFTLVSKVTAATLYPDSGATVVREVPYRVPAGSHQLILADLPRETDLQTLRLAVTGALMGRITMRDSYVPPREVVETPALQAAKAEVERIEGLIAVKRDEGDVIGLAAEAAKARLAFLAGLGEGQSEGDAERFRALSRMIGEETVAARQSALEAGIAMRAIDTALEGLDKDLTRAQAAVQALVPEVTERAYLAVEVKGDAPMEGVLTVTYNIYGAGWRPIYDVTLIEDEQDRVTLARGAMVAQNSGENWQGVTLTLSTVRPAEGLSPSDIWPELLRIEDPLPPPSPMPKTVRREVYGAVADAPEPVMAEEAAAVVSFDGLAVTYVYPETVDLASDADEVRLALGEVSLPAMVQAEAVPRFDSTAYVVATARNESGEVILPATAQFYMNGRFVGSGEVPMIAAGDEARLGFGAIDGMLVERIVSERNEGDRGVISRSNQRTEEVRLVARNLTARSWDVRIVDSVPYSEQEDLVIAWTAKPAPSVQDLENAKGVLAWDMAIDAGKTAEVSLSSKITWPAGKELR